MATDPSISAALAELKARRAVLDRAISALEDVERSTGAAPVAAAVANGASPETKVRATRRDSRGGGIDGVGRVLYARPGEHLTPDALAKGMFDNGWETDADDPARAARAAANRLRKKDARVKLERAAFIFRPDGDDRPTLMEGEEAETDAAAY